MEDGQSKQTALLALGLEDRSDARRAMGEERREGRVEKNFSEEKFIRNRVLLGGLSGMASFLKTKYQ